MAGAEKIKEKILEEARLQAQKNLEQAEKEAAEIIQSAQKEAEQKKSEIIERAHKEAVDRKKRLIAAAELEARKQKLQAKQEVVEEAFTRVLNKLNSLPADQYQNILVDMVVRSVRKGNEEIILSDKDKQRLGADFINTINNQLKNKGIAGNVQLSNESRKIDGGFILKTGEVEINNSFEAIMRMQRAELEAEVVKVLF
ncbi:MAG: V/A-type H+/Na+-transporting ATPase subunit [Petroclostridium sp.]|jgi:V/A-type H+-transporting ATPase subunit E|uniref:V-type ATP synthase subunit E n=1 Tax=Petroclostridium xylanilyticum TaxID=1792311 RepID=UPI000B99253D|nr:V-type ATP synthase subunit E family protein [Petroclostridium xylanilyticum]MDK2811745.1 V/A-type H+/Na+-transporting ATPase subunit [Petroclostridium sp.]